MRAPERIKERALVKLVLHSSVCKEAKADVFFEFELFLHTISNSFYNSQLNISLQYQMPHYSDFSEQKYVDRCSVSVSRVGIIFSFISLSFSSYDSAAAFHRSAFCSASSSSPCAFFWNSSYSSWIFWFSRSSF